MNRLYEQRPIIGLSPMDGITDAAFRHVVDYVSKPSLLYTEFVPAEAVAHGITRILPALLMHKTNTPSIAQFFGTDPNSFYKSTLIAAALGYDGIDINMGCPNTNIVKKRGGASLIGQPVLAIKLIKTVKKAVLDWQNGIKLSDAHINPQTIHWIKKHKIKKNPRLKILVSVKTRTGLDKHMTKIWISHLIESKPDMIALHGRTLLQMYKGKADWDEISLAQTLCRKAHIFFLGNGDIKTYTMAQEYIKKYRLDGVLVGRSTLGNPWFFSNKTPPLKEIKRIMIFHCLLFTTYRPDLGIFPMRKHLAWYCKSFFGSRKLRNQLTQITNFDMAHQLISQIPE